MTLTGTGNKCPNCGKEFLPTSPLEPNTKNREFYGGRIKFFKDVDCDCTAKYRLCITKKFNRVEAKEELEVINMIVLEPGFTKEELEQKVQEKIEEQTNDKIHEMFEDGRVPSMRERENIKKEVVLASIVGLDEKIETLCMHTLVELQLMCKANKVKYPERANKTQLAKLLLAKNPNLVEANPLG